MKLIDRFRVDPEFKEIINDIKEHTKDPRDVGSQEEKWIFRLLYDLTQTARLISKQLGLLIKK